MKWSYAANWGEKAFTALFTLFLAAVLGPKDFGLVAIALVYVSFLQMLLDQGFAAALVQRKRLDPEHMDAVFWVNFVLSLVFVAASTIMSRWWALLNHAPQAASVISVLSLCIPIEGLAIVQKSLLSREMDFKSLSIRSNVSVLIGGATGVLIALLGGGVWSLVGQQIVRDLSSLLLLWKLSPWRPKCAFSWMHLKDLMGFSVSTFVAQLAIFADTYASSIVLGIFFGPFAVGLYRLADRIMNTVLVAATSSIQAVSLPEFSRLQGKPAELRKSVLACLRLSSTLTLPALSGTAAVSAALMATLGAKWMPAASVLQILCLLGMSFGFAFFTGPLLQSMAKVKLAATLEWFRTLIGIVLLLTAALLVRKYTVDLQILTVAVTRLFVGAVVITPLFLYFLMRLAKIRVSDLLSSLAPSLIASVAIVISILPFHAADRLLANRPPTLLFLEVLVGSVVGSAFLLGFDVQLRAAALGFLRRTSRNKVALESAV